MKVLLVLVPRFSICFSLFRSLTVREIMKTTLLFKVVIVPPVKSNISFELKSFRFCRRISVVLKLSGSIASVKLSVSMPSFTLRLKPLNLGLVVSSTKFVTLTIEGTTFSPARSAINSAVMEIYVVLGSVAIIVLDLIAFKSGLEIWIESSNPSSLLVEPEVS